MLAADTTTLLPGTCWYDVVRSDAGNTYDQAYGDLVVQQQRDDWDAEHDTPSLWEGGEVIEGKEVTPRRFEYAIPPVILGRPRYR
jgi:hypothetical protein